MNSRLIKRVGIGAMACMLVCVTPAMADDSVTAPADTPVAVAPAPTGESVSEPSGSGVTQPIASVLYFQDGHDIAPVKQTSAKVPNSDEHGGLARLATVLADECAKGIPTDTAFGGDLGGGTLFGAMFRGEAMVDAFNTVGVNIAGFGQHDFDFGLEQTMKNVRVSSFPWVSSNLAINGFPILGKDHVAM